MSMRTLNDDAGRFGHRSLPQRTDRCHLAMVPRASSAMQITPTRCIVLSLQMLIMLLHMARRQDAYCNLLLNLSHTQTLLFTPSSSA